MVRALASGQRGYTLAVPLALHVSARIAERDPEDFLRDPTQLANALRDLIEAVEPDGVPVTDAAVLLAGCTSTAQLTASEQLTTALEATRRLRASYGDRIALLAALPGPAAVAGDLGGPGSDAAKTVVSLGREFLAAGADVILVGDESELPGAALSTLANIARFHQGVALSYPADRYGLTAATVVPLDAPSVGAGITATDELLARETDLGVLRQWVSAVRG